MVSHHLAKFGGHRYCGGAVMFLIVKEHNSTCLFKSSKKISEADSMKAHGLPCSVLVNSAKSGNE